MIDNSLHIEYSIEINANTTKVWDALTNPDKIKEYLYGTETVTTWKVGAPIVFQGEYEGTTYKDKGVVLENNENKVLKYSYWSSFSGMPDTPDNYHTVAYELEPISDQCTKFTWKQAGFSSEEKKQHTNDNMPDFMKHIKQVAEA